MFDLVAEIYYKNYRFRDEHVGSLQSILTLLAEKIPFEYACVLSRAENSQYVEPVAEAIVGKIDDDARKALIARLGDHLDGLNTQKVDDAILKKPVAGFACALVYPLVAGDEVVGLLAACSTEKHSPKHLEAGRPLVELAQTVLENAYMRSVMEQMVRTTQTGVERVRVSLINAVMEGVLIVAPAPEGAEVVMANQRFLEMFDIDETQIINCTFKQLVQRLQVAESLREELTHKWLSIPVRAPGKHKGAFQMTHSEGHPMDLEWYSAPVYHQDYVFARIFVLYDRTAERTAQRLRSAFISRVSHELRTPLTSISGFAEFILEATGDELPDIAREYTEIILSSARHLNHVFTDMIEITKADAGEIKLNRTDAHLPDVIIDAVARLELMYKERNQQIIMALDDELPTICMDVDRIAQVVTNLLTNAIKYTPENSIIRVKTAQVMAAADLPPGAPSDVILPAVLVMVDDEGKGLSKDEVDKVFLPFYRTEATRKSKIEGVGLGLAVTRSIIEMHRGKLWAEPRQSGKTGGHFLFTLPL